jgi:hypothetical protein
MKCNMFLYHIYIHIHNLYTVIGLNVVTIYPICTKANDGDKP